MTLPTTMKASISTGDGHVEVSDIPVPHPGPGQILVKVVCAALNPPEGMAFSMKKPRGIPFGHDFAGTIAAIGQDVPQHRYIGERVAGFINGCISLEIGGAFAEYCLADAQVLIKLPDSLSFEDAAGLGLAGMTACQALWQNQKLPTPHEPMSDPFPILIWGGASTVGQHAIQLAKLSGMTVITTASPKNHTLLKSLGADVVFDYRDPNVSSKILKYTRGGLKHSVDCISEGDTPKQVVNSFGEGGGYVAAVLPVQSPREDVKMEFSLVYTFLGKAMDVPYPYPAIPSHYALGVWSGALLSELLKEGKLKTTPVRLADKGIQDVEWWIKYQLDRKVSAEKITFRIGDTPSLA